MKNFKLNNKFASIDQKSIIFNRIDSHVKVIAGAGSGKSTTMVDRVLYLMHEGVDPNEILIMMFNRDANDEFTEKLKNAIPPNKDLPLVKTYHSLALKILNDLSKGNKIDKYELRPMEHEPKLLAKDALTKVIPNPKKGELSPHSPVVQEDFVKFIDFVKSSLDSPEEVFKETKQASKNKPFLKAFEVYEEMRAAKKVWFFSDLIYDLVKILKEKNELLQKYQGRRKYIIVDEYQDINPISQELVKLLAGTSSFVTVVGDDDQTIYEFRGSKPDYLIDKFDMDFKNPDIFQMTETFRFGHTISLMANNLIGNNENRVEKLATSSKGAPYSEVELKLYDGIDDKALAQSECAKLVASEVESRLCQGVEKKDIAILLRVYAQTPAIEFELLNRKIGFKIDGGESVFSRKEVTLLTDIVRMTLKRPKENMSRYEILQSYRNFFTIPQPGVTNKVINEMVDEIAQAPDQMEEITKKFCANDIHEYGVERIRERVALYKELSSGEITDPLHAVQVYLSRTNLIEELRSNKRMKRETAETMISSVYAFVQFCKTSEYKGVELLKEIERIERDSKTEKSIDENILMTTVHRSKGLDWNTVIIPNCEECKFPYVYDEEEVDIESERRLFYVAMTRAKKYLVFLAPIDDGLIQSIKKRGNIMPINVREVEGRASRFIYELNYLPSLELGRLIQNGQDDVEIKVLTNKDEFNGYLKKIDSKLRVVSGN